MATDLKRQLQRLKQSSGLARRHLKVRPSLLYEAKAAADISTESILAGAVAALDSLAAEDPPLRPFRDALFTPAAASLDRALLTAEDTAILDAQLEALLLRLGPHVPRLEAVQVLELLVRVYRVEDLNVTAFLGALLHVHDDVLFARAVGIANIKNTCWYFLEPVKRSGAAPPRARLVTRALQDPNWLRLVCAAAESFWRAEAKAAENDAELARGLPKRARRQVAFWTAWMVEVLEQGRSGTASRVDEALVRAVLPCLLVGLGTTAVVDLQLGSYMVLSKLVQTTTLASGPRDSLLTVLLKHACPSAPEASLLAALVLLRYGSRTREASDCSEALPMSAFRHLLKVPRLGPLLGALAATHDVAPLLHALFGRTVEAVPLHQRYATATVDLLQDKSLQHVLAEEEGGAAVTACLVGLLRFYAVAVARHAASEDTATGSGDPPVETGTLGQVPPHMEKMRRRILQVLKAAGKAFPPQVDAAVAALLSPSGTTPSQMPGPASSFRRPRAGSLSDVVSEGAVDGASGRIASPAARAAVQGLLEEAYARDLRTTAQVPLQGCGRGLLLALEEADPTARREAVDYVITMLREDDAAGKLAQAVGVGDALLARLDDADWTIVSTLSAPEVVEALVTTYGPAKVHAQLSEALRRSVVEASTFLPTGALHLTASLERVIPGLAAACLATLAPKGGQRPAGDEGAEAMDLVPRDGARQADAVSAAITLFQIVSLLRCPWDAPLRQAVAPDADGGRTPPEMSPGFRKKPRKMSPWQEKQREKEEAHETRLAAMQEAVAEDLRKSDALGIGALPLDAKDAVAVLRACFEVAPAFSAAFAEAMVSSLKAGEPQFAALRTRRLFLAAVRASLEDASNNALNKSAISGSACGLLLEEARLGLWPRLAAPLQVDFLSWTEVGPAVSALLRTPRAPRDLATALLGVAPPKDVGVAAFSWLVEHLACHAAAGSELAPQVAACLHGLGHRPLLVCGAFAASWRTPAALGVAALNLSATALGSDAATDAATLADDAITALPLLLCALGSEHRPLREAVLLNVSCIREVLSRASAPDAAGKRRRRDSGIACEPQPLELGDHRDVVCPLIHVAEVQTFCGALLERRVEMAMDAAAVGGALRGAFDAAGAVAPPAPKRRKSREPSGQGGLWTYLLGIFGSYLKDLSLVALVCTALPSLRELPALTLWDAWAARIAALLAAEDLGPAQAKVLRVVVAGVATASTTAMDALLEALKPESSSAVLDFLVDLVASPRVAASLSPSQEKLRWSGLLALYFQPGGSSASPDHLRRALQECQPAARDIIKLLEDVMKRDSSDALTPSKRRRRSGGSPPPPSGAWLSEVTRTLDLIHVVSPTIIGMDGLILVSPLFALFRRLFRAAHPSESLPDGDGGSEISATTDARDATGTAPALDCEAAEYACRLAADALALLVQVAARDIAEPEGVPADGQESSPLTKVLQRDGKLDLRASLELCVIVSQSADSPALRHAALGLLGKMAKVDPAALLALTLPILKSCTKVRSPYDFDHVKKILERLLPALRTRGSQAALELLGTAQLLVKSLQGLPPSRRPDVLQLALRGLSARALPALQLALLTTKMPDDAVNLAHSTAHATGAHAQVAGLVKLGAIADGLSDPRLLDAGTLPAALAELTVSLRTPTVDDDGCGPASDARDDDEFLVLRPAAAVTALAPGERIRLVRELLAFVASHLQSRPLRQKLRALETGEARRVQGTFLHLSSVLLRVSQRAADMAPTSQTATFAEELQHAVGDALGALQQLLSARAFVAVVQDLLNAPHGAIRRRALSLLQDRLEAEEAKKEVGNYVTMAPELVRLAVQGDGELADRQTAVWTLDILARCFAASHPTEFLPLLGALPPVAEAGGPLGAGAVVLLGTLVAQMGVKAVAQLKVVVPTVLSVLDAALRERLRPKGDLATAALLAQAALTSLATVAAAVPQFLNPYLPRLLGLLFHPEITAPRGKEARLAERVRDLLARGVAPRLLLPQLPAVVSGVGAAPAGATALVAFAREVLAKGKVPEALDAHPRTVAQFEAVALEALAFRETHGGGEAVEAEVRGLVVDVSLKLSERQLGSLLERLRLWAYAESGLDAPGGRVSGAAASLARRASFAAVVGGVAASFGMLGVSLLAQLFHEMRAEVQAWVDMEGQVDEKSNQILLLRRILDALRTVLESDVKASLDARRLEPLAEPLVSLVATASSFPSEAAYRSFGLAHFVPTLAAFARSAASDELWRPFTRRLLLFTRGKSAGPTGKSRRNGPAARFVALAAVRACFEKVGEEFLVRLPECLPFLAELLEDDHKEVRDLAKDTLRFLEELSGEDMDEYLL